MANVRVEFKGTFNKFEAKKAEKSGNTYYLVYIEVPPNVDGFGEPIGSASVYELSALGDKWKEHEFTYMTGRKCKIVAFLDTNTYVNAKSELKHSLGLKLYKLEEHIQRSTANITSSNLPKQESKKEETQGSIFEKPKEESKEEDSSGMVSNTEDKKQPDLDNDDDLPF